MLRNLVARVLAVIVVVTASVAVFGSPAAAFTRDTNCFYQNGTEGQTTRFFADNGDLLTTVDWYWKFPGQGNAKYMFTIDDYIPGADTYVRVDNGSTVFQYDQNVVRPKVIGFNVRKYRVVWNGYVTAWLTPSSCYYGPINP